MPRHNCGMHLPLALIFIKSQLQGIHMLMNKQMRALTRKRPILISSLWCMCPICKQSPFMYISFMERITFRAFFPNSSLFSLVFFCVHHVNTSRIHADVRALWTPLEGKFLSTTGDGWSLSDEHKHTRTFACRCCEMCSRTQYFIMASSMTIKSIFTQRLFMSWREQSEAEA